MTNDQFIHRLHFSVFSSLLEGSLVHSLLIDVPTLKRGLRKTIAKFKPEMLELVDPCVDKMFADGWLYVSERGNVFISDKGFEAWNEMEPLQGKSFKDILGSILAQKVSNHFEQLAEQAVAQPGKTVTQQAGNITVTATVMELKDGETMEAALHRLGIRNDPTRN